MSIRDIMIMLKWRHHVASQRIQDFLETFFMFFPILNVELSGEQEKESIIHVRMW